MQEELIIDIQASGVDIIEILGDRKKAWTISELADVLSCSKEKLYDMVAAGSIPYFKIGTGIRFNPKSISEWVESQMVTL